MQTILICISTSKKMGLVVMVGQKKDLHTFGLAVEPHGDVRMVDIVMSVRYVCTYGFVGRFNYTRSLLYCMYMYCEEFNDCYRLVSIWMSICLLVKNTLMLSELASPLKTQP